MLADMVQRRRQNEQFGDVELPGPQIALDLRNGNAVNGIAQGFGSLRKVYGGQLQRVASSFDRCADATG